MRDHDCGISRSRRRRRRSWCSNGRYGYVVQPYDGAAWVALESPAPRDAALAAFAALRRLNVLLYERLSAEQRARPFRHPEMGQISVDWVARTLAGHDLHHLGHLTAIAAL